MAQIKKKNCWYEAIRDTIFIKWSAVALQIWNDEKEMSMQMTTCAQKHLNIVINCQNAQVHDSGPQCSALHFIDRNW